MFLIKFQEYFEKLYLCSRALMLISKFMWLIMVNNQLQHTYCQISHEVKGIRQYNFAILDYNRNIFLEKSYPKCDEETIPTPFSKNSKLNISLDQQSKVLYYRYILKLTCRSLAFTSYNAFLKIKKRSGTSPPASF